MAKNKISVSAIDALLPQTQCTKCGYDGCLPYAQSMAKGCAINKCPPGGIQTVQNLANLLQIPLLPLQEKAQVPQVAVIKADECIGCTKCLAVCPTDAIIGAGKLLHIVIEEVCSGCELCLKPCPVDCITIKPLSNPQTLLMRAQIFRPRYLAHQERIKRLANIKSNHKAEAKKYFPNWDLNNELDKPRHNGKSQSLQRRLSQLQATLLKTKKQQQLYGDEKLTNQIITLQQAIKQLEHSLS